MKIVATPFINRKARKFMLRLRHEQHRKLRKAAALSGETMSRFIYRAAMIKADAVLAENDELEVWDRIVPVGREFGSPDFDRLMEEDIKNWNGQAKALLNKCRQNANAVA